MLGFDPLPSMIAIRLSSLVLVLLLVQAVPTRRETRPACPKPTTSLQMQGGDGIERQSEDGAIIRDMQLHD
jgi:hypothetical protein